MNSSFHRSRTMQDPTDYYFAMASEIEQYKSGYMPYSNVGLGIDLVGGLQPGLTELLQQITSYEQAVGKAFLASRRAKSATNLYNSPMVSPTLAREAYASPEQLSSDYSGSPASSPQVLQSPSQHVQATSNYFPTEMPLWRPIHRPTHARSHTAPVIRSTGASTPPLWSEQEIEGLMSFPDFPRPTLSGDIHVTCGGLTTEVDPIDSRHHAFDLQDAPPPTSDAEETTCSPTTPTSESHTPSPARQLDQFATHRHDHPSTTTTVVVVPAPDAGQANALPNKRPRNWTTAEDEQLRTEVRHQQAAGVVPLPWTKIGNLLGHRNGVQCQARWAEVLDENIRKGRWSSDEDDKLRHFHAQFRSQWSKIAENIQTRTQRQCRSRWLQLASGPPSFRS